MKRQLIQCISNYSYNSTPQEVITAVKKAGFDGAFIQWMNRSWEFSQKEQLKMCRSLGLKVDIGHLNYDIINDIWLEDDRGDIACDKYLEDIKICKENNIGIVILHPSVSYVCPSLNQQGIKRLQKIVDYAKELNIKVALENAEVQECFEYVLDNVSGDNFGICYDAGHDHCFFKDNFKWGKYKNKIFIVHLHDNHGERDEHLLSFDGTINWKEVINKLKEANYKGDIILENRYFENYAYLTLQEFYTLSKQRAEEIRRLFD